MAFGLMSVVAISMNSSSRNIRSVIEAAENDLSTFDPCLIAIARYFWTGWFRISMKAIELASIWNTSFSMRATR